MSAAPEAHDVALMLVKHLRDVLRTIDTPSYDRTSLGDVLRYHIDAIERPPPLNGHVCSRIVCSWARDETLNAARREQ